MRSWIALGLAALPVAGLRAQAPPARLGELLDEARRLESAADAQAALAAYSAAIAAFDPRAESRELGARAYEGRARLHGRAGRHLNAVSDASQAIALDPACLRREASCARLYLLRRRSRLALGDASRAGKDLGAARALDPRAVERAGSTGAAPGASAGPRETGFLAGWRRLDPRGQATLAAGAVIFLLGPPLLLSLLGGRRLAELARSGRERPLRCLLLGLPPGALLAAAGVYWLASTAGGLPALLWKTVALGYVLTQLAAVSALSLCSSVIDPRERPVLACMAATLILFVPGMQLLALLLAVHGAGMLAGFLLQEL